MPTEDGKNLKLVAIKAGTLITPTQSQYEITGKEKKKTGGYSKSAQLDRISSDTTVSQYIKTLDDPDATREHLTKWKMTIWRINRMKASGIEPNEEELEQKRVELLLAQPAIEVEWQQHYFGRILSAEEREAIERIRQKQLDLFDE